MSGRWCTAIGRPGEYKHISELVEAVHRWLLDRSIQFSWQGEHTHTLSGEVTHSYEVYITDEESATLFLLRWG